MYLNNNLFFLSDRTNKIKNSDNELSKFIIEKVITKRERSSVNLVKKNNEYYIMKIIENYNYKSENQILELNNILTNLQNPYVINYHTLFKENGNLYIITEYIKDGKNFLDLIKENIKKNKLISEIIIWDYLRLSLNGLLHLNKINNITHINIKPNNLLITKEGNLKIYNLDINKIKINENKDFESYDTKMLGETFYYLMSNKLPKINDDKNINIELPKIYSEDLRKIINSFITSPTPIQKAFTDFNTKFSKYFKITSIFTILQCLLSIPPLICFFENGVEKYIKYDEDNKYKKYVIFSCIKSYYNLIKQQEIDFEKIKIECKKLKFLIYNTPESMTCVPEVEPNNFLTYLLTTMHNELNRYIDNSKKDGYNNINDINSYEDDEENGNNIEAIKPQSIIFNKIEKFTEKYRSKISEIFYYLEKTIYECSKCKNIINNFCDINYKCDLYPDDAATFLQKINLNIIGQFNHLNINDLFKHYRKKRLYEGNEYCPYCENRIKLVYHTKIFYNSPLSLILVFNHNNKHKIQIDEEINIQEFVEMKEISKVNYKLYGAVFSEEYGYEDKNFINYISIYKKGNNKWIYFNGNSIENDPYTFKNIINIIYQNNKKLKMLFYSRN